MDNLQLWKIGKKDVALARTVKRGLEEIANPETRPKDFVVEFDPPSMDFDLDEVYYVVGENLSNILGYAECYASPPQSSIGDASWVLGHSLELVDFNGAEIQRANIPKYDGYSRYSGRGEVVTIFIIEAFRQRMGIGSRLIEEIKKTNPELIEAKANGYKPSKFFEANDFVDTGIDSVNGDQIVMVWNNPNYSR